MIPWVTIKPGLLAWIALSASLPPLAAGSDRETPAAIWEDEDRPYGATAWAIVSVLNTDNIGSAGLEYVEDSDGEGYGESWGGESPPLQEDASQLTSITIRLKFECMAHTRGAEAETYAENLRGRLYATESVKALEAIGLGFTSVGLATPIRTVYDDRIRSTFILDLRFHAANVSTSRERYSAIEKYTSEFAAMRVPK